MQTLLNNLIQLQSVATVNYFKEIFNEGPIKMLTCIGTGIIGMISTYFTPIHTVILVVLLLIIADAVLGARVALSKGGKIETRKLWSTVKKFAYACMIISFGYMIDLEILRSFDAHLVEFFAGMISGVELWSMIENLQTLDPSGPWKIFSKFIKTKGEKYLEITIDKEDLPKIKQLCKKIK